jgi:dienelactone hydrolase
MAREVLQAPRMLWHLRRTWKEARVVDREVFSRLLPHLRAEAAAGGRGQRGGQGKGTDMGGVAGAVAGHAEEPLCLACMGFCFGGWVVAKSCCREEEGVAGGGGFACGVGAHPSWNVELLHGGGERAIAEHVRCPMLLMPASNDSRAVKPGGAVVRALGERHRRGALQVGAGAGGCMSPKANVVRSVEFRDRKHGWVTRGDEACPAVAADQSRALDLACEWFGLHLAP